MEDEEKFSFQEMEKWWNFLFSLVKANIQRRPASRPRALTREREREKVKRSDRRHKYQNETRLKSFPPQSLITLADICFHGSRRRSSFQPHLSGLRTQSTAIVYKSGGDVWWNFALVGVRLVNFLLVAIFFSAFTFRRRLNERKKLSRWTFRFFSCFFSQLRIFSHKILHFRFLFLRDVRLSDMQVARVL